MDIVKLELNTPLINQQYITDLPYQLEFLTKLENLIDNMLINVIFDT